MIHSLINGYYECIDIQIYYLVKAIDDVWLYYCLNDLFDTLSPSNSIYKIALVYQSNVDNLVAVNNAVGSLKEFPFKIWSSKGGTWGPSQLEKRRDREHYL